jgi:hypothetical protein
MSGIVNLESALRTCKVDTGYSSRIQSDRFLNPRNLVCPVWNGLDTAGRLACADSFKTKREGCNSAEDRVGVENSVSRPQYMTYISMQTAAGAYNRNYQTPEGVSANVKEDFVDFGQQKQYEAGFGDQKSSMIMRPCGYNKYDDFSRSQGL